MPEQSWVKRYTEGIVIAIISAIVLGAFASLFHAGNTWAAPIFYGFVAAAVVAIAYLALTLVRRIPKQKVIPTPDNIEQCVHSWLDAHRISVQNDPSPTCYFRFRIELNGKHMTVLRTREEYKDYVEILADLGTHGDNKIFEHFTDDEVAQIIWDAKVELSRAQVGYSGLENPPNDFMVFRRVPIHHGLTEFAFISFVASIEAAINLVGLMLGKSKAEVERRAKSRVGAAPQLLASDSPKMELPD